MRNVMKTVLLAGFYLLLLNGIVGALLVSAVDLQPFRYVGF